MSLPCDRSNELELGLIFENLFQFAKVFQVRPVQREFEMTPKLNFGQDLKNVFSTARKPFLMFEFSGF